MQEIGKLEQKEIDRLKALHGGLNLITVKDEEGNIHYCYVKKPDLKILSAATKYVESDPVKSGEIMFNSLKVECSEFIEKDDELKMSVISRLGELFKIRETELKKL